MLCAWRLESRVAALGRVAKIPVLPARSRARLKVVLCDLGKPLGVFGQIGFVAVQQLGQSWALAIVAGDPLPLCVTGKLWKYLRNVLKQLLAFRW
jgi:hypothetical protein